MPDVYDREIEYLADHPDEMFDHWTVPSPLFAYCTPSGWQRIRDDGLLCGCLTLVRSSVVNRVAWTDELTEAIQADERIPDDYDLETFEDRLMDMPRSERIAALLPFAEWQRRIDKALGRTPPESFIGE